MTTPATATTKHWAPLDGIRGSALLFMLAYHLDRSEPKSGFFSIDMFFVLSGFLITSLLVGEREKSGLIHFGNFYARRALRLLPALFELLVLVLVLSLIFGNRVESHQTLTSIPYTLFYIANWHQVYGYLGSLGMLDHTWSLSLEEQFYLIWPITLVGLLTVFKNNRRLLAIGLMIASVGDMIYRYVLVWNNHSFPSGFLRVYYATDTHCDGLLMGCGMALLLASRTKPASDLARKFSKV
ncbi:MAG TPA: acyltransferase, partial [Acidimicrobiales bacterium]